MARLAVAAGGAALAAAVGLPPQVGWAAGMYVGNMVFAEDLPTVEGPRVLDKKVTSSGYAEPIPRIFGTSRMAGNIIWAADITEHRHESTQRSGKGGGQSQTSITYTYTADFAVAFAKGPIAGVRKIWADAILVYDASETNSTNVVHESVGMITVYNGSETQQPDPLIESYEGAGTVPAHRGLAYVVFDALQLQQFGNRIPNITLEVVSDGAPSIVRAGKLNVPHVGTNDVYITYNDENDTIWSVSTFPSRFVCRWDVIASAALETWQLLSDSTAIEYNKHTKSVHIANFRKTGFYGGSSYNVAFDPDGNTVIREPVTTLNATQFFNHVMQLSDNDTKVITGRETGNPDAIVYADVYSSTLYAQTSCTNNRGHYGAAHDDVNGIVWALPGWESAYNYNRLYYISEDNYDFQYISVYTGDLGYQKKGIAYGNGYIYVMTKNRDLKKIDSATKAIVTTLASAVPSFTPSQVTPVIYDEGNDYVFHASRDYVYVRKAEDLSLVTILNAPNAQAMTLSKRNNAYYIWSNGSAVAFTVNRVSQQTVTLASAVAAICSTAGLTASDIDVTSLASTTVQGYAIDQTSARRALAPLMQTYFFDATESNFKIKFVRRV